MAIPFTAHNRRRQQEFQFSWRARALIFVYHPKALPYLGSHTGQKQDGAALAALAQESGICFPQNEAQDKQ
jgi:hypothetical protein